MVRVYKNKSNRASWTDKQLKLALDGVENGKSIKSCAAEFGIPRSTLQERIKNKDPGSKNGKFKANLYFI